MRRFALFGLVLAIGTLLARTVPDARRYFKISTM
jgi:hypothetical protein